MRIMNITILIQNCSPNPWEEEEEEEESNKQDNTEFFSSAWPQCSCDKNQMPTWYVNTSVRLKLASLIVSFT